MNEIKVSDVYLSPEDQKTIRFIATHWEDELQMVDWRTPKIDVPTMLYHKLERLGAGSVDPNRNYIQIFNNRIRELVERFDQAEREAQQADQWEKAAKWLRSKKWSFPIMVVVVGLPMIIEYLKMFIWLFKYFTGQEAE